MWATDELVCWRAAGLPWGPAWQELPRRCFVMVEEGQGPGAWLRSGTKGVLRCSPRVLLGSSALRGVGAGGRQPPVSLTQVTEIEGHTPVDLQERGIK